MPGYKFFICLTAGQMRSGLQNATKFMEIKIVDGRAPLTNEGLNLGAGTQRWFDGNRRQKFGDEPRQSFGNCVEQICWVWRFWSPQIAPSLEQRTFSCTWLNTTRRHSFGVSPTRGLDSGQRFEGFAFCAISRKTAKLNWSSERSNVNCLYAFYRTIYGWGFATGVAAGSYHNMSSWIDADYNKNSCLWTPLNKRQN